MIVFLGKCIQNLYSSLRYTLSGRTRISAVIAQAATISYDSLIISLVIVIVLIANKSWRNLKMKMWIC